MVSGVLGSPNICVFLGASGGVNSFVLLRSSGCSPLVVVSIVGLVFGVIWSDLYVLDKSNGSSLVKDDGLGLGFRTPGDERGVNR